MVPLENVHIGHEESLPGSLHALAGLYMIPSVVIHIIAYVLCVSE